MPTLIVTESSAKARTIGSALRNLERDSHWIVAAAPGVDADWPRKGRGPGLDWHSLRPKFDIRNRSVLNKVLLQAAEAEEVLIATEDSNYGESLALHFKRELLEKMPNKTVNRLRLHSLAPDKVLAALKAKTEVDDRKAEAFVAGRVIDRIMALKLNDHLGHVVGRAITPALAILNSMARKGKAVVVVEYTHSLFGDTKVSFFSNEVSIDAARKAVEWLEGRPAPKLERETEELASPSPLPYNTSELIRDGIEVFGFKSIEVITQALSLYDAGYITSPLQAGKAMEWRFLQTVLEKIKALVGAEFCSDAFAWTKTGRESCHPVDIAISPDEVPKPVRPLYRMIWAKTLASCSRPARVNATKVSFKVPDTDVEMHTYAHKTIKPGHDRLSLGLFLPDSKVPDDLDYKYHDIFEDGWPHEADLIKRLSDKMKLVNPAAVVKALENLDYVRFRGSRVVPTFSGHSMLAAVDESVPEMASPDFFDQIEYRLSQIESGEASWDEILPEYRDWVEERIL